MGWVAGVDAGGSKCAAVLLDERGAERARGAGGPGNPNGVGAGAAAEAIWTSCREALATVAEPGRIARLGVGFAGGGSPQVREALARELASRAPSVEIALFTDLECALEGAFEGRPGVLVVAGTGSSAIASDGAGKLVRAGGFGPRLGDEGSGYWIAARALARALEEPLTSGAVLALYREELGVEVDADLAHAFHRAADRPARIASIAEPLLARCGEHPIVAAVLDQAAEHLVALVVRCAEQSEPHVLRVACIGGLLQPASALRMRFARALEVCGIGGVVVEARRSPEWGAAQLALRWRAGPS